MYELQKIDPRNNGKLRTDDRVFKLSLIDNKAPLTSTGLVDRRLFTGENRLHACKDPQYGLWFMKYENGVVPEALKQQFTTFTMLHKVATDYFNKRNIRIDEVID